MGNAKKNLGVTFELRPNRSKIGTSGPKKGESHERLGGGGRDMYRTSRYDARTDWGEKKSACMKNGRTCLSRVRQKSSEGDSEEADLGAVPPSWEDHNEENDREKGRT